MENEEAFLKEVCKNLSLACNASTDQYFIVWWRGAKDTPLIPDSINIRELYQPSCCREVGFVKVLNDTGFYPKHPSDMLKELHDDWLERRVPKYIIGSAPPHIGPGLLDAGQYFNEKAMEMYKWAVAHADASWIGDEAQRRAFLDSGGTVLPENRLTK